MINKIIENIKFPVFLIVTAILARVLPHPANFTPITAIAIFGGSHLTKRQAYLIPVLVMVLSDFIIGFDSISSRIFVYGSFLLAVVVGQWIKNNQNTKNIIIGTLLSSILFFVITNFGVWMFGKIYSKDLIGLISSYYYAIPFFKNTLLGDLFYSGIFFGGYELVKNLRLKNIFAFKN